MNGSRRIGGVLLLVVVVLGALLVARVDGVRVAGTAVPVPGSGVPRVGDCVGEVTGQLVVPSQGAFPPPTLQVAGVDDTAVVFSSCADPHVGEVVAFRLTLVPAGTEVPDPQTWCRDIGAGYQANRVWWFRAASGVGWVPSINQRFVAILSTSADQPWSACAVLAPGLELYTGSYVESFADRPAPAPFGLCRAGDERDRWVSCTSPHRVQEFGVAAEPGMSSREAVAACGDLIKAMTGMEDVNAGGVLKVQVVGGTAASTGRISSDPRNVDADFGRCRLIATGPHQLTGTLIGIGSGTLPLS